MLYSQHSSSGNSGEALWGHKPKRWWTDFLPPLPPHPQNNRETQLVVIKDRIKEKTEKKLSRLNKNKKGVNYAVVERVMAKAYNVSNASTGAMAKFLSLYEGLYKIMKKLANNVYILWNEKQDRERGQCHANGLRKYRSK